MLKANTGYFLSPEFIHLFSTCTESLLDARSEGIAKNTMEKEQVQISSSVLGAHRRGSSQSWGRVVKESVPEEVNSKLRSGSVNWPEVEG